MYAKQILSHKHPRISIPNSVGDTHTFARKGDKVKSVKGEKIKKKKKKEVRLHVAVAWGLAMLALARGP